MAAKASFRQAENGKGIGLVALVDIRPGEEILLDGALFVPLGEELTQPLPNQEDDRVRTLVGFVKKVSQVMNGGIHNLKAAAKEPNAAFNLPKNFDRVLFRPIKNIHPGVADAIRAVALTLDPDTSHEEKEKVEKLVARFLTDCREFMIEDERVWVWGIHAGATNHSCQPNAHLDMPRFDESPTKNLVLPISAIGDIKAGEEITIGYHSGWMPDRDSFRKFLKEKFGFECRCDACVAEEKDATLRDIKDLVMRLFDELKNCSDNSAASAAQVYRKAATILDGFDILGLKHGPVGRVLEMCADHAKRQSDMLRFHFFSINVVIWHMNVFGKVITRFMERHLDQTTHVQDTKVPDLNKSAIDGYSVYNEYKLEQEGLQELMFMMGHKDGEYHRLQVVNGKVEEVPQKGNAKRLKAILEEWVKNAGSEQENLDKKKLHEMSVEEALKEIEDDCNGEEPKKKKKKKGKKKQPHQQQEKSEFDGPFDKKSMAYEFPFICPFGRDDAISKQAWLANETTKQELRLEGRDIGHLLAAKDGWSVGQEGHVLRQRRDSVCGRIQGDKEMTELQGKAARRVRTHSFSNDGGKKDMLKEAEIREGVKE